MITAETVAHIRRLFYAEHWKIGTIAQELGLHRDTVRTALQTDRFNRAKILRPSLTDPYIDFIKETLEKYPRLRTTRIYEMIRDRGYTGSVVILRRVVARLRPVHREAFLRLRTFPGEQGQVSIGHILEPLQSAVPVVGCPASFLHFLIPEPYIWSSSSIKLWRTSCAVTSGPSTHGRAALVSY